MSAKAPTHSSVRSLTRGVLCLSLLGLLYASDPESSSDKESLGGAWGKRLPGEFEPQRGLLFSCHELLDDSPELFVEMVRLLHHRIPLIALVSNEEELLQAKSLLSDHTIPLHQLRFLEVEHDTMWVRDYGPMILETDAGFPVLLDAGYSEERDGDDRVPAEMAALLKIQRVPVPYVIEGGNLLTNGKRLAIMTGQICDDAIQTPEDHEQFLRVFRQLYGMEEVVVLEALVGEPTGHVDMFATFTSADTVFVGSYQVEEDAENAAILDRNAARLAEVETASGPLQVIRIPMPTHKDGVWRTYTNVVYANGQVLVPIYPSVNDDLQALALSAFRAALPGWQIDGIDASELIESNGALHCITMNLGPIGPLPVFPEPDERPRLHEEGNHEDSLRLLLARRSPGTTLMRY